MGWTGSDKLLYLTELIWDGTVTGKNLLPQEQILSSKSTSPCSGNNCSQWNVNYLSSLHI